jgi:hypothetical protein
MISGKGLSKLVDEVESHFKTEHLSKKINKPV